MGGIFGGGGSSVQAPTVASQPQAGTAQIYQPQAQPQADVNYMNTVMGLLNQYNSGAQPAAQLYPQAQQLGNTISNFGLDPVYGAAITGIQNSPYYSQAQSGSDLAAEFGNYSDNLF